MNHSWCRALAAGWSVEFDTWWSPATGTKTLQLLVWCCPGGAGRCIKVHGNTADSAFWSQDRWYTVVMQLRVLQIEGMPLRYIILILCLWSRFFNGSESSVIHSHNIYTYLSSHSGHRLGENVLDLVTSAKHVGLVVFLYCSLSILSKLEAANHEPVYIYMFLHVCGFLFCNRA